MKILGGVQGAFGGGAFEGEASQSGGATSGRPRAVGRRPAPLCRWVSDYALYFLAYLAVLAFWQLRLATAPMQESHLIYLQSEGSLALYQGYCTHLRCAGLDALPLPTFEQRQVSCQAGGRNSS